MIKITEDIYWTGKKDTWIRSFHHHELSTHRGTTYNSYLIKDEKTVLVDTVLPTHCEEFVCNLENDVGLKNIDMIVMNHCEPDHGGSLAHLMQKIPDVPIYCTKNGADMIRKYNQKDWNFNIVKTGDRISTGKYELLFIEMQMIHWPDSMATYVDGSGVLLSNDAFGHHYALENALFDDEANETELYEEAIKYYANILNPFNLLIKRKLEQLALLDLKIDIICPSHGMIFRKDPARIVETYTRWCDNYSEDYVAVIFGTIWRSTEEMAGAIAKGIKDEGVKCKIIDANLTDKNDLVTEVFRAKAIMVGSPTINNNTVTSIATALHEMTALKYKGKPAAAFGSFGWSGESGKQISEALENSGFTIVQPPLMIKYKATCDELAECEKFGREFAQKIKG